MACFPLMPDLRRAETTGFRYDKEEGRHQFTWTVWDCPLTLDSVVFWSLIPSSPKRSRVTKSFFHLA